MAQRRAHPIQQEFGSGRWQAVPEREYRRVRLLTFLLGLSLGVGSPLFGSLLKNPPTLLLISLSLLLFALFLMAYALADQKRVRVPVPRNSNSKSKY